jgi:hypothetical protein
MAPFLTALYNYGKGDEEVGEAMTQTGLSILENVGGLAPPPSLAAMMALSGNKPMESITTPWKNTYDIREDNVGFLPENVEQAIRAQFGTQGALGLEMANAFMEEGDATAAVDEFLAGVAKRTAIVKGVGGWRTNSAYFTPISSKQQKKLDAYYKFDDEWTQHFDEDGIVRKEPVKPLLGEDIPIGDMGPPPTPRPINPMYELFGQQIEDAFRKKSTYGFPQTQAQMNALTDQIRLLRGYSAGRAKEFEQFQKQINGIGESIPAAQAVVDEATAAVAEFPERIGKNTPDPEGTKAAKDAAKGKLKDAEDELTRLQFIAKTAEFLKANHVDLKNRMDVTRLINVLEANRVEVMRDQLKIIQQIEDDLTQQLQAQGLMKPGQEFRIEMLSPMSNPLQ